MVVDGSLVRLIDQQICCLLVALVVSRSYERSWNSSLYIRRSFLNFLCWDVTICFLIVTTHSPTYSTTILTNAFGTWTDHYWFSTGSGYVRSLIWIYLYNGRRISAANQCENRYFIYYGAMRTENSCWKRVLFLLTLLCRTCNSGIGGSVFQNKSRTSVSHSHNLSRQCICDGINGINVR